MYSPVSALAPGHPGTLPSDDIRKGAERAARFIEACFGGLHQDMEVASDAYSMASRIRDLERHLDRIRIFILSDGMTQLKVLDPGEINGIPVKFEIWDIERLFRGMQSGLPRDEIEIDFERNVRRGVTLSDAAAVSQVTTQLTS